MKKDYTGRSLLNEDDEITVGEGWKKDDEEVKDESDDLAKQSANKGKILFGAAIVVLIVLLAIGAFFALSSNKGLSDENAAGTSQQALAPGAAKPSLLSININEAPTTNRNEITLGLYAKNAAECRFSNDGINWSGWQAYAREVKWGLDGGDGEKIVHYQCRNTAGDSVPVSTGIYLDSKAPAVYLAAAAQDDLARIDAEGNDDNPYGASCVVIIDGEEIGRFFGNFSRELRLGKGAHMIRLNCSDAAGNMATAEKVLEMNWEEATEPETTNKTITILINNGDATTNSRYLTLTLYARGGHLCRYKENNGQWTGYERYTTTRMWTIEALETQTIVIHYECTDKDGVLIGQASDSIEYVKNGVGSGSSSGSGGSSGGSLTLRLNSVTLTPLPGYFIRQGFTNNHIVDLGINAVGARECRYRNIPWEPAPVWTDWAAYAPSQTIEMLGMRGGDGDRLVEVECRDAKNNTVSGSARIIYDGTPPSEVDTSRPEDMTLIYSEEKNGTNHTYVMLVWLPSTDGTAGVYSYNIDKMNVSEGTLQANYHIVYENSSTFYQFIDEVDTTETYIYGFTTYDNANNSATSTRLLYCDPSQPLPANCG